MKKFLRPLLLGLILSVGVSLLTGCGKKADYAIRVGDLKISENDYYQCSGVAVQLSGFAQ